ncbi:MAG: hypothetical protein L3J36_11560 [Rhodobacteraceae bacterium]|nr:hypothetical protein [Paracoccaceae bacterium]
MNAILATSTVRQQLENALKTGHVPDEEKRRAAQLLKRLQSPVRIVLIGRQGSGKSRLINLLTGTTIVPGTIALPPLEVSHGATTRTVYLMADGSEQSLDGLHLDRPTPQETAIVRAVSPLPVLKQLSLTEVCLEGALSDQKIMAEWAMNRADIVLWCSQTFDATERAIWSSAGGTLKDHSFLVLTKADRLQMKNVLSDRLADLKDTVSNTFYRIFPVATIQAISANPPEGPRDETVWAASGGGALMDAVLHLVSTGRRADADNAMVFLRRNAQRMPGDTHHPVTQETVVVVPHPGAKTDITSGESPDKQTLCDALEFLQQRADQMQRGLNDNSFDSRGYVLDHCLETANTLTEIIMEAETSDTGLCDIQDDTVECGDMIVLYQLENTDDAATDAVTLLLQLKKEMAIAVSA